MSGQSATKNPSEFAAELLQAPAEQAQAALALVGARAAELVERWVQTANAAAVAVAAEHAEGAARKAARRGLNVLKSRGIAVPETRRVTRLSTAPAEATHTAWMLPPDTNGSVLVAIASHAPPRRPRATFLQLNDVFGVHRIDTGELGMSQLKEAMVNAAPGRLFKPVSVPVDWVRWRVATARRRHAERGEAEPLGLSSARDLLEPVPREVPPHPFDEEGLVLSDEDAKDLAAESLRLHRLPEFRSWLPPRQAVDALLAAVGEQFYADEPPDQEALQRVLQEQLQAATDRFFSPQSRERLVAMMKDSALSVLGRDGEQAALEVVAAIKAITEAGLITNPPHEIGFLRGFFDKALAVLHQQEGGQLRIPMRHRRGETAPDAGPTPEPGMVPFEPTVGPSTLPVDGTAAFAGEAPPPATRLDTPAPADSGSLDEGWESPEKGEKG
ncbi:MAG: hypothetical protein JW940_21960 [Polyangiaceae bacterium]|nr:hypothetical protein [Polyangiaceae bacterium]